MQVQVQHAGAMGVRVPIGATFARLTRSPGLPLVLGPPPSTSGANVAPAANVFLDFHLKGFTVPDIPLCDAEVLALAVATSVLFCRDQTKGLLYGVQASSGVQTKWRTSG